MNCRRFEDLREEFLDGTLSSAERAAAEEHVAACRACTEGLRQREQFGGRVTEGLQQAVQSLRLRPEVERSIVQAWGCESGRSRLAHWALHATKHLSRRPFSLAPSRSAGSGERAGGFPVRLLWRWATAAIFVAAVIWMAGRFMQPQNTTGRRDPATDEGVVIEVSYPAPVYAFQNEGEFVRDSLDYETVRVNTRLGPDTRPASPPKQ